MAAHVVRADGVDLLRASSSVALVCCCAIEAGGEAGEGFGRRCEALAGAGGCGFELRGREDA